MKIALKVLVLLSFSMLTGCSWLPFEDGFFERTEYDYTNAKITSELQIPKEVGESNIQDHYLVPELDDDVKGIIYGAEIDIMAPMQILTLGRKVRANSDSKIASVIVTSTEIRLWDIVQRYFNQEKIIINKYLNKSIITTEWIVDRDDSFWTSDISAWRYRYKIYFNAAQRPTEYVLSVELIEAQEYNEKTGRWQLTSTINRHETELLNSIVGFIYVEDITKSRQLVNQSELAGIKVSLGQDAKGNAALITAANFEHVWTRIPISLKLLNIIIEDQDRSQGLFFLTMPEDGDFFDYLAFWSSNGETLDMPDKSYRVQVAKKGENISMTFLNDENTPIDATLLAKNFALLAKVFKSRSSL